MFRLGLTGSIATGKSATARLFRAAGIPVHDADAVVHALYRGRAAPLIAAVFPGTVQDGVVDRKALSLSLAGRQERFEVLEAIVHPLVCEEEQRALAEARVAGHRLVVLDIPLLFETGSEARCNAVLVTTCEAGEQRRRVLARPGMTERLFHEILARQMPDAEKRRRAHAILDTGQGFAAAEREIAALIRALRASAS